MSTRPAPVTAIEPMPLAARVVELLRASGLPTEDLATRPQLALYGIPNGNRLSGVVGVETAGRDGLLRSLVVAPDARGLGLGRALLRHAENAAQERGVRDLYLLTETADGFFRRNGYAEASRAAVPEAIAATPEFASLCPDTALCMKKSL